MESKKTKTSFLPNPKPGPRTFEPYIPNPAEQDLLELLLNSKAVTAHSVPAVVDGVESRLQLVHILRLFSWAYPALFGVMGLRLLDLEFKPNPKP